MTSYRFAHFLFFENKGETTTCWKGLLFFRLIAVGNVQDKQEYSAKTIICGIDTFLFSSSAQDDDILLKLRWFYFFFSFHGSLRARSPCNECYEIICVCFSFYFSSHLPLYVDISFLDLQRMNY